MPDPNANDVVDRDPGTLGRFEGSYEQSKFDDPAAWFDQFNEPMAWYYTGPGEYPPPETAGRVANYSARQEQSLRARTVTTQRALAARIRRIQRLIALGRMPEGSDYDILRQYNAGVARGDKRFNERQDIVYPGVPVLDGDFHLNPELFRPSYISPYDVGLRDPAAQSFAYPGTAAAPAPGAAPAAAPGGGSSQSPVIYRYANGRTVRDSSGQLREVPVFATGPLAGVYDYTKDPALLFATDQDLLAIARFVGTARNTKKNVVLNFAESIFAKHASGELNDVDFDRAKDYLKELIEKHSGYVSDQLPAERRVQRWDPQRGRFVIDTLRSKGDPTSTPNYATNQTAPVKPVTEADVRKGVNDARKAAGMQPLQPGDPIPEAEAAYMRKILEHEAIEKVTPAGQMPPLNAGESPFVAPQPEPYEPPMKDVLDRINVARKRRGVQPADGITETTREEYDSAMDFLMREYDAFQNGTSESFWADNTPFEDLLEKPKPEPDAPPAPGSDISVSTVIEEVNRRRAAKAEEEMSLEPPAPYTAQDFEANRIPEEELISAYQFLVDEAEAKATPFSSGAPGSPSRVGGSTPVDSPSPVVGGSSSAPASAAAASGVREPIPTIDKYWQDALKDQYPAVIASLRSQEPNERLKAAMQLTDIVQRLKSAATQAMDRGERLGTGESILANSYDESLNQFIAEAMRYAQGRGRSSFGIQ